MASTIPELMDSTAGNLGKPRAETGRTEYAQQHHVIDKDEVAYEVHWRTYIAVFVACVSYIVISIPVNIAGFQAGAITATIGGASEALWMGAALQVVSAVIAPILGRISDTIGRKQVLISTCFIGAIGTLILALAKNINMAIAGGALCGVYFAASSVISSVAADVLPRRHRATAWFIIQAASCVGSTFGTLGAAALVTSQAPAGYPGWRVALLISLGLAVLNILLLLLCYKPPPVPNPENRTIVARLLDFDKIGTLLWALTILSLMVPIEMGGKTWNWSNARIVVLLAIFPVFLIVFVVHQTKLEKHGFFDHVLFRNRNFPIALLAYFVEGMVYLIFLSFFGQQTAILYDADPIRRALRYNAFVLGAFIGYFVWAFIVAKTKNVKPSFLGGFLFFLGATIGMACANLSTSTATVACCAMAGFGFASPLSLSGAVLQWSVPHEKIALAAAVGLALRGLGSAFGVSISGACLPTGSVTAALPRYIGNVAQAAGLPASSVPTYIRGVTGNNATLALSAPGVTTELFAMGRRARLDAYVYSFRYIWIMLAPFVVVGAIAVLFLKPLKDEMTDKIDRTLEPTNIEKERAVMESTAVMKKAEEV